MKSDTNLSKEKVVLIKQSDLLSTRTRCPQCGKVYMRGVPYAKVSCNKCAITYMTNFNMPATRKAAWKVLKALGQNDIIEIQAEDLYYETIIIFEKVITGMKCFNVGKLTTSTEEYRICNNCGTCKNCYICLDCNEHYPHDKHKRKQKCSHCGSIKSNRTFFTEAIHHAKKIKLCPHCKSDNIIITKTKLKTKCHLCGSKDLTEPKTNKWYKLVVRRQPSYYTIN